MKSTPITSRALAQYALIALPLAFAGFPLYVLAPDFYATEYGVPLATLGAALLVIRLLDAVQDPLIGRISDRLAGRLMPILIGAGICLCLSVFLLFNATAMSPLLRFSLCLFVATTSYSMIAIALGVRATLWTTEKADQTRIAAAREGVGLAGLVLAVSLPTLLQRLVPETQVYLYYSAILALLTVAGLAAFARIAAVPRTPDGDMRHRSLRAAIGALPSASRRLFLAYGISMLASAIPAVLVIFFVRDLLGAEALTGPFLLLYFLAGMAGMPLWKRLSARFGKYEAWAIAHLVALAGFIGAFFLGAGDIWFYGLVCTLSGLALGADLSLPPSLLADQVHAAGNESYSGTHYAFLAFLAKGSLALASALALPFLDLAGFQPGTGNTAGALLALSVIYALIPCLFKLLAAGLLYFLFIRPSSGQNDEHIQIHGNNRSSSHAERLRRKQA
ncbi:MAG: sugar transporter [Sneathiella sp.]|jgi:Na+/melibiose symporter-like transporter|uniref:MFS transporter n=1 Tax=Sneathiella sp. TaxID=1964365 RepID=UPI000C438B0F|nr:MFS transporter [Sneathiella sp.]MAL80279.1 sugar transporter [Sneathiella sp.]